MPIFLIGSYCDQTSQIYIPPRGNPQCCVDMCRRVVRRPPTRPPSQPLLLLLPLSFVSYLRGSISGSLNSFAAQKSPLRKEEAVQWFQENHQSDQLAPYVVNLANLVSLRTIASSSNLLLVLSYLYLTFAFGNRRDKKLLKDSDSPTLQKREKGKRGTRNRLPCMHACSQSIDNPVWEAILEHFSTLI